MYNPKKDPVHLLQSVYHDGRRDILTYLHRTVPNWSLNQAVGFHRSSNRVAALSYEKSKHLQAGKEGGGGVKAEISKSPPKKTVSRHRLLLCRVYDQCRSMHLVRDIQEKKNCPVYLKQVYKMAMPPKEENKKKEEREFTCTSSWIIIVHV